MKKILLSLITIVTIVSAASGATTAYFSDTEAAAGNTFATGKLDLELNTSNTLPFNVSNIAYGSIGKGNVTLTNTTGSLDGDLDVKIANYVENENSCIEPEIEAGDPCDAGDLGLGLRMAMYIDANKDSVYNQIDGDIELEYSGNTNTTPGLQYATTQSFAGKSWDDIKTLSGGQSVDLVVEWKLTDWNYPKSVNIIQTDSLRFDIQTSLEQVSGTGGVAN